MEIKRMLHHCFRHSRFNIGGKMTFSDSLGICDIWGDLETKINTQSNWAVYALCMT